MTDLPDRWARSDVGSVLHIRYGQGLPERVRDTMGRIPVYGSAGRVGYHSSAIADGPTIVIGRKGGVGATYLELGPCWPIDTTYFSGLPEGLSPAFITYQLQSMRMENLDSSTAVPSLRREDLESQSLMIAPTQEQERIVAVIEEQFSRLDAGVAALERIRQNIKRMRAAILEAAVTEWIGEGFPRIRLEDVLRGPLRNGHSAKADPLGTIPILTLTAVTLGDFGIHNVKMTSADPRRVRDLWIRPGDLLIERSNTRELVGTACLYRGRPDFAIYPDLVIRARVNDRVMPEYAELVLKAPESRRYFQQRAQGISGTMPKIDQQAIEDLVFTLPSREIQASIVQEAERRLTLLASLQMALDLMVKRSSTLRSSILTAAFSGQLATQDPTDEPASVLVERIAAGRTASNGHESTRVRKRRVHRGRVTS